MQQQRRTKTFKPQHPTPGIIWRDSKSGGSWHLDKWYYGVHINKSCRTTCSKAADEQLAYEQEQIRQVKVFGERPLKTLQQGAEKYIDEFAHLSSATDAARILDEVCSYAGKEYLHTLHTGKLKGYVEALRARGCKNKTINTGLSLVRRICKLAASEWIDDQSDQTWIQHAPMIKMLPTHDSKHVVPLTWQEQDRKFNELPAHLQAMAIFKVNTGAREHEVCALRWEWLRHYKNIGVYAFELPPTLERFDEETDTVIVERITKSGRRRVLVLNDLALEVIERQRGKDTHWVFPFNEDRITKMNNTAWKNAGKRCGIRGGVHVLRHTCATRLRAKDVPEAMVADILDHARKGMTHHYSLATIEKMHQALQLITQRDNYVLLRRVV